MSMRGWLSAALVAAQLIIVPVSAQLSCVIPESEPYGPLVFYGDGPGAGISIENHWAANFSEVGGINSTSDKDLKVQYSLGSGTLRLRTNIPYDPYRYGALQFTLRGNDKLQGVAVYLLNESGAPIRTVWVPLYILEHSLQSTDRTVQVPIPDLANFGTLISGVAFEVSKSGTVYFDDVQLVQKTPNFIPVYRDYLGGFRAIAASGEIAQTSSASNNGTFHGTSAIRFDAQYDWDVLTFQSLRTYQTSDYGAVSAAVKGSMSNQNLYVYLLDTNGEITGNALPITSYLHDNSIGPDWKVAWIPIKDLIGCDSSIQSCLVSQFSGLAFESSVEGDVWLDEVNVVEKLVWPLPQFPVGNWNGGYRFGAEWDQGDDYQCNSLNQLHTATDYSTFGAANKKVVAAHDGIVRYSSAGSAKWGGYVVIESNGNAFVTEYTHITPSVAADAEVVAGVTQIGVTAPLPEHTPHLHFTLRVKPYSATDLSMVINGVLPQTDCGGYPKFPEAFVNPELVDWQ